VGDCSLYPESNVYAHAIVIDLVIT